jgi:hypothetical protein
MTKFDQIRAAAQLDGDGHFRALMKQYHDDVRADQREKDARVAEAVVFSGIPAYDRVTRFAAEMIRKGDVRIPEDGLSPTDTPDAPHVQVGGDHYRSEITPFQVIDAWGLDFYRASALKYVMRAGNKPGASAGEDLRKAAHYLTEAADRADAQDGESRG